MVSSRSVPLVFYKLTWTKSVKCRFGSLFSALFRPSDPDILQGLARREFKPPFPACLPRFVQPRDPTRD